MNIEKFVKEDMGIRVTYTEENEILLCSKDIADVLGVSNTIGSTVDYYKFLKRLESSHLKLYGKEILFKRVSDNDTYSMVLDNTYITESLFYYVTLNSKSTKALPFQLWVCEEVLPSLRKNSFYIDESNIDSNQINELEKKVKTLRIAKGILHEIVYDIADATTMSFTEASKKLFGKNAKYLKTKLKEEGFIDSDGKVLIKKAEFTKPDNSKEMLRIFTNTNVEKCREVDDIKYSKITNFGYLYLKKHFNKKGVSNFKFNRDEQ